MEKENFEYSYSAGQKKVVESIKNKYTGKTLFESKVENLKKLDSKVSKGAKLTSLSIGIIGTLILGFGMTCVTVWTQYFALGVIIGIIGIVLALLAYPIYNKMINEARIKYAPEIIKLSEEIENGIL